MGECLVLSEQCGGGDGRWKMEKEGGRVREEGSSAGLLALLGGLLFPILL